MKIEKYLQELKSIYCNPEVSPIFRGQPDGLLNSSAFRRIRKEYNNDFVSSSSSDDEDIKNMKNRGNDKSLIFKKKDGSYYISLTDKTKNDFINYNVNLIEKAKMRGYNVKNLKGLSDLQILSELRHFGAATCLIDFTKNFLNALWFAGGGVIYVIDKKLLEKISTETESNQSIRDLLRNEKLRYWIPEKTNDRILSQESIFVFGKPILENKDLILKKIIVAKEDNELLRYELDRFFNINSDKLFPDFYGFALNNSQEKKIGEVQNNDYQLLIDTLIKEKAWSDLKTLLTKRPSLVEEKHIYNLMKNDIDVGDGLLNNIDLKLDNLESADSKEITFIFIRELIKKEPYNRNENLIKCFEKVKEYHGLRIKKNSEDLLEFIIFFLVAFVSMHEDKFADNCLDLTMDSSPCGNIEKLTDINKEIIKENSFFSDELKANINSYIKTSTYKLSPSINFPLQTSPVFFRCYNSIKFYKIFPFITLDKFI